MFPLGPCLHYSEDRLRLVDVGSSSSEVAGVRSAAAAAAAAAADLNDRNYEGNFEL